jgi:alkanesulfonate monooxygenase SsuD/methylene tetrahydromethanopterin reductase-like flavin-dependent oxidoreductase (luciferase family)
MKAIWTEEEASYHGEHVDFDAIWSWPKPVQKPHPPILMGGSSDAALRRAAELADVWMPNAETRISQIAERGAELQRLAAEAGREPLPITFYGVKPDAESLGRYAEAGVSRCVFYLPSLPLAELEPLLDGYSQAAAGF